MTIPDQQGRRPPRWPARFLATLAAAHAGVLVWATHHPKPRDILPANPPSDKILHVVSYAVLGGLVAATLAAARRLSPRGGLAAAAALAAFAVVDEATQPWFGRSADPADWVSDVVGIGAGIAAVGAVMASARAVLRR